MRCTSMNSQVDSAEVVLEKWGHVQVGNECIVVREGFKHASVSQG
jgi:hypothetical protein